MYEGPSLIPSWDQVGSVSFRDEGQQNHFLRDVQRVSGKQMPGDEESDMAMCMRNNPDSRFAREVVKKKAECTVLLSWKVVCLWGGDSPEVHASDLGTARTVPLMKWSLSSILNSCLSNRRNASPMGGPHSFW